MDDPNLDAKVTAAKKAIDAVAGSGYDQVNYPTVLSAVNDVASYATAAAAKVKSAPPAPKPPHHHGG